MNLTYPERNHEVQLYSFHGLQDPSSGDIVSGFQILMPIDVRDFADDLFKLEIVNDHELLLYMPSLPYQMQYDSANRHQQLAAMQSLCRHCQQAQEICITDIASMPSRKRKKLRLRFPEDVCLVNLASVLDGVIPADIEPYAYQTTLFGDDGAAPITQYACNVSWKLGNSNSRLKAFGSAKKSGVSKLRGMFANKCSM